jgi:hypothetical protein
MAPQPAVTVVSTMDQKQTITLNVLFKEHSDALRRACLETLADLPAADVAKRHIEPVLPSLNANAGQEMDPLYIAYMIQSALIP